MRTLYLDFNICMCSFSRSCCVIESKMAESKLLAEDKDEWFYQSMTKYSNLYMFELEFALDALEVLNETSLCISGVQTYSRKCEILQLCVPPKLLQNENEEGLCKDRDFKILSGGYADSRIKQIKSLPKYPDLVVTLEEGHRGFVVHEIGGLNRATILEKHRMSTGSASGMPSAKALCCMQNRIILGSHTDDDGKDGIWIHEWKVDEGTSLPDVPVLSRPIWSKTSDIRCGELVKIKEWDDNTSTFLTSTGTFAMVDFRTNEDSPQLYTHAFKSVNRQPASESAPVTFTFDCVPLRNKIGILDSFGGYETFDPRFVQASSIEGDSRMALSEFSDAAGVYKEWFNIEYEPWNEMRESVSSRFIISGLKKECVPVFQEDRITADETGFKTVFPAFTHDGHSKSVSHAIWHPVSSNLVISASVDAVLHAWQFHENVV